MNQSDRPASILLVDDVPHNIRLLSELLKERGYSTRGALNGRMALETAALLPPDLILLDIGLPDLDGYEVCRCLKRNDRLRDIPVIFISALDGTLDKVKAFQSGGVDYIDKPFQVEELTARVENQLTIARQRIRLQKEIDERRQAETLLETYLHAVSHDLRNPVIGMSLILNNLLKTATENNLTVPLSTLQQLSRSCDRQLNLIDSLVETRQNALWGISLQPRKLYLQELSQKIHQEWELRLLENQDRLIDLVPADLPPFSGDYHYMWRVFDNLIANAIKYNPPDLTIVLDARVQENYLYCTIADNGVGIEEEHRRDLFEPYRRGRGKGQIGLGLGLYLCRQIIEAHGGKIGIISESGSGSIFWFTLPLIGEN